MNFQEATFEFAAGFAAQLPPTNLPEIVFSGKSNVGKSSLINKLINRKALARVSSTPGKTATINSYLLPECRLIDLPGYGYARVSQAEKQKWAKLVDGYFAANRNVKLVIQLVDMRHEPTGDDIDMLNFLIQTELPFLVACTKADKLNNTQTEQQTAMFEELFRENEIEFFPFSATKGTGAEKLREMIEKAVQA